MTGIALFLVVVAIGALSVQGHTTTPRTPSASSSFHQQPPPTLFPLRLPPQGVRAGVRDMQLWAYASAPPPPPPPPPPPKMLTLSVGEGAAFWVVFLLPYVVYPLAITRRIPLTFTIVAIALTVLYWVYVLFRLRQDFTRWCRHVVLHHFIFYGLAWVIPLIAEHIVPSWTGPILVGAWLAVTLFGLTGSCRAVRDMDNGYE